MSGSRRVRAFVTVGFLGFLLQVVALDGLVRQAGLPYPLAVALAVELAILHNFAWHERWTWRDRQQPGLAAVAGRLVRFNAATAFTSIGGNVLVTVALVEWLRAPVIPAGIAAVALMSALNLTLADRLVFRTGGLIAVVLSTTAVPAHAADLTPATIAAFDSYVRQAEQRRSRESADSERFLSMDFESPEAAATLRTRLRSGEVIALAVTGGGSLDVPGGLIHHWRGYVHIAGATVDDLLAALRTPDAHRQDEVLEARVSDERPGAHVLFLKLRRTGIVTAVYNTEHEVTYERRSRNRAVSRSVSRRIAEVENPGRENEREKPVGRDRGFLWRMNSCWRYEPVPGGVIVELESITLSRDLPWGFGAVAAPIVSRVARESVVRTLAALRDRFETRAGR